MSRLPTMSKVERALACPASEALPHEAQPVTEAAEDGNGRHEALIAAVFGQPVPEKHAAWVEALREAEAQRLEFLKGWRAEVTYSYDVAFGDGAELGERLGRSYPEVSPTAIVGTADWVKLDVMADGKRYVSVLDLKTGRHEVPVEGNAQLLTLALAAARAHEADCATVFILQAPEGMTPKETAWAVSARRLEEHAAALADMMVRIEEARSDVAEGRPVRHVSDGSHCHFCPAKAACPKRSAIAVQATQPTFRATWTALAAEGRTADVWRAMKVLRGEADEMEAVLREMARHGPVDIGDGHSLIAKTVERESIDAGLAWPALVALLGEDAARCAVSMDTSKAGIERGVKAAKTAGALKGSVKAGVEQVMQAVREAGAVSTKQSERFEEK